MMMMMKFCGKRRGKEKKEEVKKEMEEEGEKKKKGWKRKVKKEGEGDRCSVCDGAVPCTKHCHDVPMAENIKAKLERRRERKSPGKRSRYFARNEDARVLAVIRVRALSFSLPLVNRNLAGGGVKEGGHITDRSSG